MSQYRLALTGSRLCRSTDTSTADSSEVYFGGTYVSIDDGEDSCGRVQLGVEWETGSSVNGSAYRAIVYWTISETDYWYVPDDYTAIRAGDEVHMAVVMRNATAGLVWITNKSLGLTNWFELDGDADVFPLCQKKVSRGKKERTPRKTVRR